MFIENRKKNSKRQLSSFFFYPEFSPFISNDIQLNSVRSALQSYNYAFYPEDVTNSNYKFFPYYLCKFDYYNIVKYYFKNNRINFNVKFDLDKDRILNAFYVFFL